MNIQEALPAEGQWLREKKLATYRPDSLSRRVKQLLENTAYVEKIPAGMDVARVPQVGDTADLQQRSYTSASDSSYVSTTMNTHQYQRIEPEGTNSLTSPRSLGRGDLSNGTSPGDPYGESIESMDSLASRGQGNSSKKPTTGACPKDPPGSCCARCRTQSS